MSKMKLRIKLPVNYYEPEEPSFDEYFYCDHCRDFVYEYCSLHGPLLVVPDNKVPARSPYPPLVPRAALTVPNEFLHIAPSIIAGAGLGVFATMTLPRGVRFGPFRGRQTKAVSSHYCWMIQDRNMRYKHAIDASDARASNWMRYVNCARHWHEQNLVAYQYRGQIYYRTIKIIPRFTELMVFYGSEFAASLNVDLRNYNSDDYCQKIASNRFNIGPAIYEELNHIKNLTNEDQNIDMSFEEPIDDTAIDNNLTTTIEDFVIIDTPEDSLDSKPYSPNQQNDMDPKSDSKNSITCNICHKNYAKRYNLKRHYKDVHDIKEKTTTTFKDILNDSSDLKSNEQCCIEPKSNKEGLEIFPTDIKAGLICGICQKSFAKPYNLKVHKINIHGININGSNTTDIDTPRDSLGLKPDIIDQNVIDSKSNDKQFPITLSTDNDSGTTCHICQKTLSSRYKLKIHYLLIHHMTKNEINNILNRNANSKNHKELNCAIKTAYKCKFCDIYFENRGRFYRHKLTHIAKRYGCTQCSYKTNYMNEYKDHIRSHVEKMLYKCDMCHFCTGRRRYIVQHLKRIHKHVFLHISK